MRMKFTFKSLLLACALLIGSVNAWAEGFKHVIYSQNYESETASDWISPNGTVKFITGDAVYGNYAETDVSGSGNRSCYNTITLSDVGTGYSTLEATTKGYV